MSPQANSTIAYCKMLANRAVELGVIKDAKSPFIYLWDERMTSQAAKVNIKIGAVDVPSNDIDSQAACLVLEDFYRVNGEDAMVVFPDKGLEPPRRPEPPEPRTPQAAPGLTSYKVGRL
jgi:hypothetical protein